MDRGEVARWVEGYERAWRAAGTDSLADLFAPDVSYVPSPWATPLTGLAALGDFWEAERDGPDEQFTLDTEIVAVDGDRAVVRASVEYLGEGHSSRWRDLWVMHFDADGRCAVFEEWPFAPVQRDGHAPPSPDGS